MSLTDDADFLNDFSCSGAEPLESHAYWNSEGPEISGPSGPGGGGRASKLHRVLSKMVRFSQIMGTIEAQHDAGGALIQRLPSFKDGMARFQCPRLTLDILDNVIDEQEHGRR